MIRVNLIEAANRASSASSSYVTPLHVLKGPGSSSKANKNIKTLLAAACFVVVAGICYLYVCGMPNSMEGVVPTELLDTVGIPHEFGNTGTGGAGTLAAKRAAIEEAKAKANRTLPMIVGEVKPDMFGKKEARSFYKDFYPLEKMQYQKATFAQLLAFLQTATPDNTGFSDVVYEAPNYYYIRGTAEAPVSQRAFIERIRSVSLEFKSPTIPKDHENITDIVAFGTLRMENVQMKPDVKEFVKADSVKAELNKFKALDEGSKISFASLEKPKVEDFGVYKRYTYDLHFLSNFVVINNFIAAWKESDVRMGITRASLSRSGKDVAASFKLEMYVTP